MLHVKTSVTLGLASIFIAWNSLAAGEFTAAFRGYDSAAAFSFTNSGSPFRFLTTSVVNTGTSNAATHVLVQGLAPTTGDSSVLAGYYQAVHLASGQVQDSGHLFVQAGGSSVLPSGSVSTPIVGIVARTGAWGNYSVFTPDSALGGASGQSSYSANELSLAVLRNGVNYSGVADYSVEGTTLILEPFTLSGGGSTFHFASTTLFLNQGVFTGVAECTTPSVSFNSRFFALSISQVPDLDGDFLPDIVDADVTVNDPLAGVAWQEDGWGKSSLLGWINRNFLPWHYSADHGFIWIFPGSTVSNFFVYDNTLGWLWTNENMYIADDPNQKYFYAFEYSGGTWLWFMASASTPANRWFHNFETNAAESVPAR